MPARLLLTLCTTALLALPAAAQAVVAVPTTIDYPGFADESGLILNGDSFLYTPNNAFAAPSDGRIRLTENVSDQQGAVWSTQRFRPEQSWSTHFTFQIGGNESGDGLAFVIQDDPQKAGAVGLGGSGLGYYNIIPSLAVEFDTFVFPSDDGSNGSDPNYPHIATVLNGDPYNGHRQVAEAALGGQRDAWIDYDAGTHVVSVYFSDDDVKPDSPLLTDTIDLGEAIGTSALVGFTAGTGAATATHDIVDWTFTGIAGDGVACDILGTPGDDPINGTDESETICGLAGNDVINGGGGNDAIVGGPGNDKLRGQGGDDHLEGVQGTDSLIGGDGADDMGGGKGAADVVRYPGRVANLFLDLSGQNFYFEGDVGGADTSLGDNVHGDVERAEGGAGNDTIYGNGRNNLIYGRGGDDHIIGRDGNDVLKGEGGYDDLDGAADEFDRKDTLDCGADGGQAETSSKDIPLNCDIAPPV